MLGYEGENGEWIHIASGDVEGYLPADAACTGDEAAELAFDLGQELALVIADSLHVRIEPDEASEEFTSVQQGEYLTVLEELDGWVKVEIDDEPGYVKAEYVNISCELDTALTMTEVTYGEGVSEERAAICDFARQYVGNPYVWGGVSLTNGADCSGFVLSVFDHFGISLPHSSRAQAGCGTNISVSELLPGDLVFYGSSGIGHVAIYIGNGQIVHASNSRTGIIISNINYRNSGPGDAAGVQLIKDVRTGDCTDRREENFVSKSRLRKMNWSRLLRPSGVLLQLFCCCSWGCPQL